MPYRVEEPKSCHFMPTSEDFYKQCLMQCLADCQVHQLVSLGAPAFCMTAICCWCNWICLHVAQNYDISCSSCVA